MDTHWTSRDFIILFRMVCNAKLMNCSFLKFPMKYFRTVVDWVTESVENETVDMGNTEIPLIEIPSKTSML